jgi:hypothetical protein
MDQVKVVLKVMGKHHFWVVSGAVLLVAVAVYAMASGNLASRYAEGEARLNGEADAAAQIGSSGPPDNENVIKAFQQDTTAAKEDVLKAWERLFKLQKEKNPWPAELGKEFLLVINSLKPDDEIPVKYRQDYQYFINNHFPELWKIIDVRREQLIDPKTKKVVYEVFDFNDPDPWKGFRARVESGYYEREVVGTVIWSNPEVLALGASWLSAPSTKQVRLAQEDLWVYEALLRIVRKTNEGSTSYHNAAIKRIDAMHIGQAGSAAFATSSSEYGASAAGGYGEYDSDESSSSDYSSEDGESDYYATTGMSTDDSLLQGRYVDLEGQPLAATATPPFAEFKMMPVRMIFLMDQRRIPDLLANCANSSMPVEVRRVSIRPESGSVLNLGAMAGAAAGGSGGEYSSGSGDEEYSSDEYSGSSSEYGSFGTRSSMPTSQATVGGILPDSMDVPVEIRGVIFVFNPPDREKLGTGSAGEETDETVAPLVPQRAPTVSSPDASAAPPAAAGGEPPAAGAAPAPGAPAPGAPAPGGPATGGGPPAPGGGPPAGN